MQSIRKILYKDHNRHLRIRFYWLLGSIPGAVMGIWVLMSGKYLYGGSFILGIFAWNLFLFIYRLFKSFMLKKQFYDCIGKYGNVEDVIKDIDSNLDNNIYFSFEDNKACNLTFTRDWIFNLSEVDNLQFLCNQDLYECRFIKDENGNYTSCRLLDLYGNYIAIHYPIAEKVKEEKIKIAIGNHWATHESFEQNISNLLKSLKSDIHFQKVSSEDYEERMVLETI